MFPGSCLKRSCLLHSCENVLLGLVLEVLSLSFSLRPTFGSKRSLKLTSEDEGRGQGLALCLFVLYGHPVVLKSFWNELICRLYGKLVGPVYGGLSLGHCFSCLNTIANTIVCSLLYVYTSLSQGMEVLQLHSSLTLPWGF